MREGKLAAAILARWTLRFGACAAVVALGAAIAVAVYAGLAPALAALVFLTAAAFMATRP